MILGQPCSVLAFRKRLKNAGYFDIHIISDADFWIVSACEPLGGYRITVREKNLDCFFRRKLRGGGFSYCPPSREFTDQQVNQQESLPTNK